MAEESLDEADVGPVVVHYRCCCVSPQMASTRFAHVASFNIFPHQGRHLIGRERLATFGQEESVVRVTCFKARAYFIDVPFDPGDSTFPDGDHAILLPFALAHHDRAAVVIHVVKTQVHDLHPSYSRGIECL